MEPATADPAVGFPTDKIPPVNVKVEFANAPVAPVTVSIAPGVAVAP